QERGQRTTCSGLQGGSGGPFDGYDRDNTAGGETTRGDGRQLQRVGNIIVFWGCPRRRGAAFRCLGGRRTWGRAGIIELDEGTHYLATVRSALVRYAQGF